jgi:PKD repeat protein
MNRAKESLTGATSFHSKPLSLGVAFGKLAAVLLLALCYSSGLSAQSSVSSVSNLTCANTPTCDHTSCGFNSCGTPAQPPPSGYWGTLQPADPSCSPLPANRDATSFNTNGRGGLFSSSPWAAAVTIRDNIAYVANGYGVTLFDVGTNPAAPAQVGKWNFVQSGEIYTPMRDVSVPVTAAGTTPVVALVGGGQRQGAITIDVSSPTSPREAYWLQNTDLSQVYAATINGHNYGYLAANASGLVVLNLDTARALNACVDASLAHPTCTGVIANILTGGFGFVRGLDHYMVTSSGNSSGFRIYDIANATAPALQVTGLAGAAGSTMGVTMWKANGHYYVAARQAVAVSSQDTLYVYDATCITTGCTSLGSPLSAKVFNETEGTMFVTASASNGTPFLYLSSDSDNQCPPINTVTKEWLLDMTNPAAPNDISPAGYWAWYYQRNPTGFNYVLGRGGEFNGSYFYRAAYSVFDVHKLAGNQAPVAGFTWSPSLIYPGTPVTFTNQSTGGNLSYAWTFEDGSPSTSTQTSPVVSFPAQTSYPANMVVSLGVSNSAGNNTSIQNVAITNPAPAVSSITISPASPLQCQVVTLTANATGAPTLGYSWTIKNVDSQLAPGGTSTVNPFIWDTKANGVPSGSYRPTVTVTNSSNNAVFSPTQPFTLGALPTLALSGSFPATSDAFTDATVQFHVTAAGATEWNWNFGDNANGGPNSDGYTGWTTDPLNGPNPIHTYNAIGRYTVTVQVRNCVNLGPNVSTADTINVTQTTPLIASFAPIQSVCLLGFCVGQVGIPVGFADFSTGAATYDYDWVGDGSNLDTGHTTPVLSHTYTATGTVHPKLTVRRGAESNSFTFTGGISIGAAEPASLRVSGPGTGAISTPYSFAASASNCTLSGNSTWSVSGGTITGSSTGSSVTVAWPIAGTYLVSVSNPGCANTIGSTSILISGGGGGGGGGGGTGPGTGLSANFSFSPSSPAAGATVSFDGSSSTGSPTTINWAFGDGASAATLTTTHAFTAAGTYSVTLTVSKAGTGAGCFAGVCSSQKVATVTVISSGPPPPPPLDGTIQSASCAATIAGEMCTATTGTGVSMNAKETRGTSYTWDFGDGTGGSGSSVDHTWSIEGEYIVKLTVTAPGITTGTGSLPFNVTGPPPPPVQTVLLPWVTEARGVSPQSSDLYVHNPDTIPVDVTLTFLKRGTPEANPPQVTETIQPGATFYAPNVLPNTFNEQNVSGFVSVSAQTNTPPILTAYNTTTQTAAAAAGQSVAGVTLPVAGSKSANPAPIQDLIGLNTNSSMLSTLGLTNPNAASASYRLQFFDNNGNKIGDSGPTLLTLGGFGQRQFQTKDLATLFGVGGAVTNDYRVELDTATPGQLIPFGSNVNNATGGRSYIAPGSTANSKVYILGAINTAAWQTDLLLANASNSAVASTLSFVRVGVGARPSTPVSLLLSPGQTQRVINPVGGNFHVQNAAGVVTINSTSDSSGLFPLIRAETYNNTTVKNQYRGAVGSFTDADAATAGQTQYVVGLRQDANDATTLWLFNPSSAYSDYDVIIKNLDGTVIRTIADVQMPPGRMLQYTPVQLRLGAAGVPNGFTVQINVKAGSVLSAAQVVNNATQAPSYLRGVTR